MAAHDRRDVTNVPTRRQSSLATKENNRGCEALDHPLILLQSRLGNARLGRLLAMQTPRVHDDDPIGEGASQTGRLLAQRSGVADASKFIKRGLTIGASGGTIAAETEEKLRDQRGMGSALDDDTRRAMEDAFGTSFSGVRVHSDRESHRLSNELGAVAFTAGNEIFLGPNASTSDRRLLAHELAHVVQQRSMSGKGTMTVGAAHDPNEQSAEAVAEEVIRVVPARAPDSRTPSGIVTRRSNQQESEPCETAAQSRTARTAFEPFGPAMQQLIGNAAVAALLNGTRPTAAAAVMRYGTGEHPQFGSSGSIHMNGVPVEKSDLIAMGDFFASPDDMYKADPAKLSRLVELIDQEKAAVFRDGAAMDTPAPAPTEPATKHVSTAEWQDVTGGKYLELAKANDAHFAAPATGIAKAFRGHKFEWMRLHKQALDLAHAAAPSDYGPELLSYLPFERVPSRAVAVNGFASHFLTDAFAAGHLVAKSDVIDAAKRYWDKVKTKGRIFKESSFTKEVARLVLGDPRVAAKFKDMELCLITFGPITETRFSEFLMQMEGKEPDQFYNVFAKIVHDKMNQSIGGGAGSGIEVENEKGDTWPLSGDDTLKLSPQTLKIARQAVEAADKNLEMAATTTKETELHYDALYARVWAFTPRPTEAGKAKLDELIATYADSGRPEAAEAFANITIGQIDLVIAKLFEKGLLRRKLSRPSPGTQLPDGSYQPGVLPGGAYIDKNGKVTVST